MWHTKYHARCTVLPEFISFLRDEFTHTHKDPDQRYRPHPCNNYMTRSLSLWWNWSHPSGSSVPLCCRHHHHHHSPNLLIPRNEFTCQVQIKIKTQIRDQPHQVHDEDSRGGGAQGHDESLTLLSDQPPCLLSYCTFQAGLPPSKLKKRGHTCCEIVGFLH